MTNKVYRTARGKTVDMGTLRLQNENVRAVGNMGVNARGDRIDAQGNIIDSKGNQLSRRIQRQTNVTTGPVAAGGLHTDPVIIPDPVEEIVGLDDTSPIEATSPVVVSKKTPAKNIPPKATAKTIAPLPEKDPKDLEDEDLL